MRRVAFGSKGRARSLSPGTVGGQEAASISPELWGSGPSRLRPGPLSMTHEDVTSERRSVPQFPQPYGEDDNGTPFEGIRGGPLPKKAFPRLGPAPG